MLTGSEKTTLRTKLNSYEGNVAHMYLDSNGHVTVGTGHLVSSLIEAQNLNLVVEKTSAKATKVQIKTDYETVKKQPKNKRASYYKKHTKLIMTITERNKLTNKHIESFYKELKRLYSDFDDYPTKARLALFDMIFNLGMTRLKSKYPNLNKAVKAKKWTEAAAQSHRKPPISDARNKYVKELFEAVAKAADKVSTTNENAHTNQSVAP